MAYERKLDEIFTARFGKPMMQSTPAAFERRWSAIDTGFISRRDGEAVELFQDFGKRGLTRSKHMKTRFRRQLRIVHGANRRLTSHYFWRAKAALQTR